jgi:Mn2+/Fe2+ NRAMP family transporter
MKRKASLIQILASAAALFAAGKRDIQSAADAAVALRPLAGSGATFLMLVANNKKIMGNRVNGVWTNLLGWAATAAMFAAAIALFLTWGRA